MGLISINVRGGGGLAVLVLLAVVVVTVVVLLLALVVLAAVVAAGVVGWATASSVASSFIVDFDCDAEDPRILFLADDLRADLATILIQHDMMLGLLEFL